MLGFIRSALVSTASCLAFLLATGCLAAGPISIDFSGVPANASNSTINSYMQSAFAAQGYTGTVTVTGAAWANGYNGEGHAVGPVSGSSVSSVTLGSMFGGNFLINNNGQNGNTGSFDRITMNFSQPITSISFTFEIFPNGEVPNGTGMPASSLPDFTASGFLNGVLQNSFHINSVMPGINGTFAHSPSSGVNSNELAPQLIGSATLLFPNGINQLQFIDWPDTIGIDNLHFNANATATPEPGTLLLLGVALGGLGIARYRHLRNRVDQSASSN